MSKILCPYCSTGMEWSDEIDLFFNGDELGTIDIYSCNKCLKDFEVRTEFEINLKNYRIIDEFNESE